MRVELLDGEVRQQIKPTPQRATAINQAHSVLFEAFDGLAVVSARLPVRLDEFCELEPDISLKRGAIEDYSAHPTPSDIILLLDVAGVSSAEDLRLKTSIYARAEIAEYWILDIEARQLEIHRGPQRDSAMPFGLGLQRSFDRAGKRARGDRVEAG